MREAASLMERPAGGWDSLATKEYVDAFGQQLRAEFRRQATRLARWVLAAVFAGVAVGGAIGTALGELLTAR